MAPRASLHEGGFFLKWNVRVVLYQSVSVLRQNVREVLRTSVPFFFVFQPSLESLPLRPLSLSICKSGSCF